MSSWLTIVFHKSFRSPACSLLRASFFSSCPQNAMNKETGRVINVAIIGAPNAGKSTLINNIVGRNICAASNKVHTTTKLARAICFEKDTQIIFLDTPGVITAKEKKKYQLPESMLSSCYKSLNCADVVGVVHDVSNKWYQDTLHRDVVSMLEIIPKVPSFLIINKVDVLKSKEQLLTIIRNLTNGYIAGNPVPGAERSKKKPKKEGGYSLFSDVFLVSALKGDGVEDIKTYLKNNAKPATLHYSSELWTDQKAETIIVDIVRAKFLDFLDQEIPYKLKTSLELYEDKVLENKIVCHLRVECPSERLLKLIQGAGGGRLQQIKSYVRSDLMNIFKKPVVVEIRLAVKSKDSFDFANESKSK